jgi:hypothetical protein
VGERRRRVGLNNNLIYILVGIVLIIMVVFPLLGVLWEGVSWEDVSWEDVSF